MQDRRIKKRYPLQLPVQYETRRGDRGYQADIAGVIEVKEGSVSRLDLVAKGEFWGEGTFTPNAPKGKFPLAVACRSRVIPTGAVNPLDTPQACTVSSPITR